jgi:hypothetical protein
VACNTLVRPANPIVPGTFWLVSDLVATWGMPVGLPLMLREMRALSTAWKWLAAAADREMRAPWGWVATLV